MTEKEEVVRVRLPGKGEVFGEVEEVLGASRFKIACSDGHTRICRIPGKFRKMLKIKVGYYTIVKPWDVEPETRGDVMYIYTKTQTSWLRRKGLIK